MLFVVMSLPWVGGHRGSPSEVLLPQSPLSRELSSSSSDRYLQGG